MRKIWKKPLHKRKIWKKTSTLRRLEYYMQPLVDNLQAIWVGPIPFPTMLKLAYSCLLGVVLLLPILFSLFILLVYFGIFQYVSEQHSWFHFGVNWDLLGALSSLWHFQVTNSKYQVYVNMCIDPCTYRDYNILIFDSGLYAHRPELHLQLKDDPTIPSS